MKSFLTSLIIIIGFSCRGQVNLNSSLTACYALNGNASEPVNNLTGLLSSVTATIDRFNNSNSAYYFSGTNSSYIQLPNSSLIKPSALTLSLWIKPTTITNNAIVVFTKNIWGTSFSAYALSIENAGGYKFSVYRQNGSSNNIVSSTTNVSQNVWYHVVFSIDNTSMKIYVNGVLENTTAATITSFNYDNTRGVILGGTNESNYNVPFNGSIDNVRFYNRILTTNEVNALYTQDPSCSQQLAPFASFSVSSSSICAGNTFTLTDLSSNTPNAWNWQTIGASTPSSSTSNPTLNFPNPGNYTISLVSSNTVGVSNTATQTITVLPSPTLNVTSSGLVCIGQSATLSASGATSYSWNTGQTAPSIVIGPSINSFYIIQGFGNNGCSTSAQINMTIVPIPTLSINGASTICPGEPTTLTISGNATTYTWNTGNTGSQLSITPQAPTTYSVIGSNASGCINSAAHTISFNSIPTISVSGSGTICQGSSTSLLAAGTAITFTWSNGASGNLVTVTPPVSTIYTVSGTGVNGCKNSATQLVFVNSSPAIIINSNNTSICLGDAVVLNASGAATYSWSGGVVNNAAFYPSTTSNYSVSGTGTNSCKNTATIQIVVNPLPVLTHSILTTLPVCAGEPIVLAAGGANLFSWSNGGSLPTTTVTPTSASNYTVTGTDANSCKNSYVFILTVEPCISIQENNSNNSISVFPNPNLGEFVIKGQINDYKNLKVINLLGDLLLQRDILTQINEMSINIENQPKGIYFILLSNESTQKTFKFVKE